jgi:hypothetical protein
MPVKTRSPLTWPANAPRRNYIDADGGEWPLLRQVSVAISNAQALVLHQWAIT